MTDELKKGDKVEWKSSQGTIAGTIQQKLTEEIAIKGHHVAASEENPEYLVTSDKTGAEAAHKPESLKKVDSKANGKAGQSAQKDKKNKKSK
jgi:hypothetical protein